MKNTNKKRKLPLGYFTELRIRYGENDPISKLPNGQLQRDSQKIFRDMQRGNLQWETEAYYFLDMRVLAALESEATTQRDTAAAIVRASEWYVNTNQYASEDQQVLTILATSKIRCEAYELLIYCFQMLRLTGDLNYLSSLLNNIKRYRNVF